ncbi:MAG: (2Fe-2S)-binding protein [Woeseiaceae bacterium]|nr:(2Fe-2S)-binding protein [Woeseiaceae bacterium]
MPTIAVNGERREVQSPASTPLLYVLRNELDIGSPQFGCGMAQCGSCSVLLDGVEFRACVTPLSVAADKEVTTLEGLPGRWAKQNGLHSTSAQTELHPVQAAWIEKQAPQCGYCHSGMMIKAVELLEKNPKPSDAEIKAAFTTSGPSAHLCRCGSYIAILEAVRHASELMSREHG